jgi:hypothetical protein
MSEQEHEIRVHHYRRVDTRSNAKELVTEIVVAHSDTGRFLKKMEETRLTRPCYQVLDMRGKVLGECRPYVFNDRVHYLDDISYAMFQRGLEQNRGHYTVGTFESIIFGAHTLHAMNAAREEERQRTAGQARRRQGRERELRDTTGEADSQASMILPVPWRVCRTEVRPTGLPRPSCLPVGRASARHQRVLALVRWPIPRIIPPHPLRFFPAGCHGPE